MLPHSYTKQLGDTQQLNPSSWFGQAGKILNAYRGGELRALITVCYFLFACFNSRGKLLQSYQAIRTNRGDCDPQTLALEGAGAVFQDCPQA